MSSELYWIDGPWAGRLAIASRPRGGDWLEDDVRSWRQAGLAKIVSLLTADEVKALELSAEQEFCRIHGIEYVSFPIVDRGIPDSREGTADLIRKLDKDLTEGRSLALHCRQGIGRSALIAACLLVTSGIAPDAAFQQASAARGCAVPETTEQHEWVRSLAPILSAPLH